MEVFVRLAYIIVEFNMNLEEVLRRNWDKFCVMISLYAYDGKSHKSNSHTHLLECFSDMDRMDSGMMDPLSERNNMFWQLIRTKYHVDEDTFLEEGKKVSLHYIIAFSYSLCNLIHDKYKKISKEMVQLILSRITPDDMDETDCGGQTDSMKRLWLTRYEGELYLRRLYLTLKEQNMVNDCNISDYIGSRQQCLYGCVCFMLLFFSMYDSINLMKVKNIDWFQGTIIKGGCSLIRNRSSIPINHEKVLRELGGE